MRPDAVLKRALRRVLPHVLITVMRELRNAVWGSPFGEVSEFHYAMIRPEILSRWRPRILEIGVLKGGHTRQLLSVSTLRLGTLTSIDPAPAPLIAGILRLHPLGRLIRATSVHALTSLVDTGTVFDVAIVDGDHNYYTVTQELTLIEKLLALNGVVFLHDVGWPYGRRDMYYAPGRIPEGERHPFARRGLVRDQSDLLDAGGVNDNLLNALHEGGAKNGVLTAVEDFLSERHGRWSLEIISEQHGLGILRRCATSS